MNALQELIYYIESNEQSGAFLLTGKWGCGKTYLINQLSEKLKQDRKKDNYIIVVISIFGITTIDALTMAIKQKVLYARANLSQENADKLGRVSGAISKGVDFAKGLIDEKVLSGISSAFGTVLSINPIDFVQVEREVGKNGQLVLIFDDFERSDIDKGELLGAINEYVETKRIKTILVADEDKIESQKYKEFKEKVISHTLRFTPDYHDIITSIISEYKETVDGYKAFLKDKANLICEVFFDSKSENLRILRSLLVDFERVFRLVNEMNLNQGPLDKMLTSFGKVLFKEKSKRATQHQNQGSEGKECSYSDIIREQLEAEPIGPIKKWIQEGIWDDKEIRGYLEEQYRNENPPDEWKLLNWPIWQLDDSIFKSSFPLVLSKAYQGDLTCAQLIRFIQRLARFKALGIPEIDDVDYGRMDQGFNIRVRRIKEGEITEANFISSITLNDIEELDEDDRRLCKKAYEVGDRLLKVVACKREFIRTINSEDQIALSNLRHFQFEAFDQEMMDAVFEKYRNANFDTKTRLIRTIRDIMLKTYDPQKVCDMQVSIENLHGLRRAVEDYRKNISNIFAGIVDEEFSLIINEKISELEEHIKSFEETE